jgi:hypothetical protein
MRGFGRFAADGDNLVLFDQHKEKTTLDRSYPTSPKAGPGARTARS